MTNHNKVEKIQISKKECDELIKIFYSLKDNLKNSKTDCEDYEFNRMICSMHFAECIDLMVRAQILIYFLGI